MSGQGMSDDIEAMKKRRDLMLRINGIAALVAIVAIVARFKFDIWWALYAFIGVLLVGFATQIWFVYSITSKTPRKPRASKGA